MSADPHGETGRYEELAKKKDPFWWAIRKEFSRTSVATIVGLLVIAGGWTLRQEMRIEVLEFKVVVVEKVGDIDKRLTGLETNDRDKERRIARVEANIDLEYNEQVKAAREKRR